MKRIFLFCFLTLIALVVGIIVFLGIAFTTPEVLEGANDFIFGFAFGSLFND